MDHETACDWSDRLEAGAHHWLPAYGFQQPADLQEALLQQGRAMEIFSSGMEESEGGAHQAFLFLETIMEETSDDLRSESSCSGPAGWPDSDSDTASVIHVCSIGRVAQWGGSERELAVPCKRRRHNTDPGVLDNSDSDSDSEPEAEDPSRSSSLLQFETLERHCDDVFRTTASSEPFAPSPSRVSATFSFDSLEARWRPHGSRDSLEDTSSEDDTVSRSFSSRSGHSSFRSSSGIRSCRSFDSLVLSQCSEKSEHSFLGGELSQSLNNTSMATDAEEPAPTPRGIYKTVECLTEVEPHAACTVASHGKGDSDKLCEGKESTNTGKGSERSAENLSEDSGFGEHMSTCNLARVRAGDGTVESHGGGGQSGRGWDSACDARAKYNCVNWQSAPDLAGPLQCERRASVPNLYSFTFAGSKSLVINYVQRQDEEEVAVPEIKDFPRESSKMASRFSSVASTPDLYSATEEFLANERRSNLKQYAESTSSLSRTKYDSASRLSTATGSSRGSNIQITTSFVNLAQCQSHGGSARGVHFCPVVSEVSWQESASESEDDSGDGDRTGSESSTPPFEQLVERLRASPARRPPPRPLQREDSIERRRIIEELHKLKLQKENVAPPRRHVGSAPPPAAPQPRSGSTVSVSAERPAMEDQTRKKKHGIGGFFQRFSFRRLSGRDKKKDKKKKTLVNSSTSTQAAVKVRDRDGHTHDEDFKIIPLHAPGARVEPPPVATPAPAPEGTPPPRRSRPSPVMATATTARGLLETDLDSDIAPASKKTRSLLNLDDGRAALKPCPVQREDSRESDSRAKSMEFLLDKENQAAIQPPENELQKVGAGGERVMSEHQLRVQRSLQKLNIPEWYKNSTLPAQGFLLKRNSDVGLTGGGGGGGGAGWQGLNNKTTSLSSLGSTQSAAPAPRSPNSHALSPSPTSQAFSRWSTSRLSSGATSTSTSPCGSTRSSFNYRQPYLGWRSQERLSRPRTPAERLAADLLAHKKQESGPAANAPNLNEVRTSIKEVTSAIVHYVSGTKDSTDRLVNPRWDRDTSSSRSASPRGSTGRLCWLESSFVGSRPLDVPETPATASGTGHDLYLDLNNHSTNSQANGELVLH